MNPSLKNSILILLSLLYHVSVFSQDFENNPRDSSNTYIEIYGMGSINGKTPFWLQSNKFGTVSGIGRNGTIRGGIQKYWSASTDKVKENGLIFGIGAEVVGNLNKKSAFILPQLNASLRFKNWEVFVGRKKQWVGLADSTLGTGSYAWSTNALPLPKIQIGTVKFIPVPFTKDWISFNGFYSDGIMDKNRPVTNELKLHQKALYVRIGKHNSRLKLYGGFNHQVEWGGKTPYHTLDGQMPKGFNNYINVVTGKAHTKTPTVFDSTGRVGNHLGSVDVALEIETYATSLFLYRQSLYDDGSLIWLNNIADGLNGIRLTKKNHYGGNFEINQFVFEFLYTKSQGGPSAIWSQGRTRGKDDYFNNAQVRDGWSYQGRGIGTPFIPPTSDTKWNWPTYADFFTSNNRVTVIHTGISGTAFNKLNWYTKLSYSSNAGTYNLPFESIPKQFSGILGLQAKINWLGGSMLKGSLAVDNGNLYRNNFGFSLGLRKNFTIN